MVLIIISTVSTYFINLLEKVKSWNGSASITCKYLNRSNKSIAWPSFKHDIGNDKKRNKNNFLFYKKIYKDEGIKIQHSTKFNKFQL